MRRLWLPGIAIVLVAALVVGLALLFGRSIYSRAAFGTWDPSALPTRIPYCDRTYLPGSHVNRAQIAATGNGLGVFPFRQVGSTADGKAIFARPLPDSVRHRDSGAPLPCDMGVYLKVGADDYIAYGLSGGP